MHYLTIFFIKFYFLHILSQTSQPVRLSFLRNLLLLCLHWVQVILLYRWQSYHWRLFVFWIWWSHKVFQMKWKIGYFQSINRIFLGWCKVSCLRQPSKCYVECFDQLNNSVLSRLYELMLLKHLPRKSLSYQYQVTK